MAPSLRSLTTRARDHLVAAGARARTAARTSRRFLAGLVALLALLAFMLAAPIRSLDTANQRVEYLRASRAQLSSSVTELEQRKTRLRDERHIEQLARSRFGLVRKGETAYVVVTPEDELRTDGEPPDGAGSRAWYHWLVDAVVDMLPS